MNQSSFLEALELVKQHHGTGGQTALAKAILSLYNSEHAFSIGEVLGALDLEYSGVVLAMVSEYAVCGETAEVRQAGEYVYKNFPGLVQLSAAMCNARAKVLNEWDRQRKEEMRSLYPN